MRIKEEELQQIGYRDDDDSYRSDPTYQEPDDRKDGAGTLAGAVIRKLVTNNAFLHLPTDYDGDDEGAYHHENVGRYEVAEREYPGGDGAQGTDNPTGAKQQCRGLFPGHPLLVHKICRLDLHH